MGNPAGTRCSGIQKARRCVVRNLDELDFLVSRGVKPSNIRLMTELKPRQEWHQAHVGIFYDVL